jgi:nicotinate-nucleotide adenylyltransferase
MRLGIFGGTFDPVHYGHLLLAEYCREACRLDQVWFVPAAVAPHKREPQPTSAERRADMLKLAIAGHEAFHVSRLEVDRGGISYTVDTLAAIHADPTLAGPHAADQTGAGPLGANHVGTGQVGTGLLPVELFLLMGSDSLTDLPNWREPDRICQLATPVVVRRAGQSEPNFDCLAAWVAAPRLAFIRGHLVTMPLVELASREIRRRVARGLSIRYQTPRGVEMYILTQGLYRQKLES